MTAHEKDLMGVAFQASEQVLCDVLLDKILQYGFFTSPRKKKKNTISSPRDFTLGDQSKETVDFYDNYAQKLLANTEGFLEEDVCNLRKAEATRTSSHGCDLTWLHFCNSRGMLI